MPEPRLLTRAALRQHLGGIAWSDIETRMKRGQLPTPLWNIRADDKSARWDRCAVDRALDAASNIPGSIESDTAALDHGLGIR